MSLPTVALGPRPTDPDPPAPVASGADPPFCEVCGLRLTTEEIGALHSYPAPGGCRWAHCPRCYWGNLLPSAFDHHEGESGDLDGEGSGAR